MDVEVKKEDEIDAVVEVTEEKSTMAIVKPFEPQRHQLRVGKDKRVMKKIKKELELDAKLGLTQTSEETAKEALIHDIDKLTNSRDYHEITKKQLKKLFKIKELYFRYCLPFNIIEKINMIYQIFFGTISCKILGTLTMISSILGGLWLDNVDWHNQSFYNPTFFSVTVFAVISGVVWIVKAFNIKYKDKPVPKNIDPGDYRYTRNISRLETLYQKEINKLKQDTTRVIKYSTVKVDLHVEPIKETHIKIPYGAKLKLEEAFDSKIFETFVIAYPKFSMYNNSITIKEKIIPKIDVDPAICGVTADDRFFMVVYWDIEKDIDRTAQKIKHFKKFKLKSK